MHPYRKPYIKFKGFARNSFYKAQIWDYSGDFPYECWGWPTFGYGRTLAEALDALYKKNAIISPIS